MTEPAGARSRSETTGLEAPAAAAAKVAGHGSGAEARATGTTSTDPTILSMPFDKALADLQGVVARLEAGGLPLEESIALYERGVALHERCAALLAGAELRVQRLVDAAGGSLRTVDLRPDDEE
jgi:exodeoxyribonuclease VII small subunit